MLQSPDDILGVVARLYPEGPPRPFLLLQGVQRIKSGEDARSVRRAVGSTRKRLEAYAAEADPVAAIFGCDLGAAAEPEALRRPRDMIGQLLLGQLAERAFEAIYKETMGTDDLMLEDARGGRNDTDYRVLNGQKRAVFRINIKFYGTLFRKAGELCARSHAAPDLPGERKGARAPWPGRGPRARRGVGVAVVIGERQDGFVPGWWCECSQSPRAPQRLRGR